MENHELQRIMERKMREMQAQKPAPALIDHPVDLTQDNFAKVLDSGLPVLVDFWAEWCGPCLVMHPAVKKLASKYAGKVIFGRLNVDQNNELAMKYQVYSIPTFILFKGQRPMASVIGAVGETGLDRFILQHI